VLPLAVALMLLLAGVLSAARTPRPQPGARAGRLQEALRQAPRLGVGLAVALPAVLALSQVLVKVELSVFDFDVVGGRATLEGSLPVAALYGLLWGTLAGFAGSLLVNAFAAGKRPGPPDGDTPARPTAPPPAAPPPAAPAAPEAPAAGPYAGLPHHPAPQQSGDVRNPYRAAPADDRPYDGFNPYADGPADPPPPPPVPPVPPAGESSD